MGTPATRILLLWEEVPMIRELRVHAEGRKRVSVLSPMVRAEAELPHPCSRLVLKDEHAWKEIWPSRNADVDALLGRRSRFFHSSLHRPFVSNAHRTFSGPGHARAENYSKLPLL